MAAVVAEAGSSDGWTLLPKTTDDWEVSDPGWMEGQLAGSACGHPPPPVNCPWRCKVITVGRYQVTNRQPDNRGLDFWTVAQGRPPSASTHGARYPAKGTATTPHAPSASRRARECSPMFSATRRWFRRNRTPLAVGVGVLGAGYLVANYVVSKINETRERMSSDRIAKDKCVSP